MTLTLPLKPLVFGTPTAPHQGLGEMVSSLVGSEILRIAGEVRALAEKGQPVLNLTVGRLLAQAVPDSARARAGDRPGARRRPDQLPAFRRRPGTEACGDRLLSRGARPRLPAGRHPHRRRRAAAHLCALPRRARSRRQGGLPGPVVEQQPLLPPGGSARCRCRDHGRERLSADRRRARAASRRRPPAGAQQPAEPCGHRLLARAAPGDRAARRGREPPSRTGCEAALPALRPDLLAARRRVPHRTRRRSSSCRRWRPTR